MALERRLLARIDRRLLSEMDHEKGVQLVKVPVSDAVWSTWRRYCDAVDVELENLGAMLEDREARLVEAELAVAAREKEVAVREAEVAPRERRLAAQPTSAPPGSTPQHRTARIQGRKAPPLPVE